MAHVRRGVVVAVKPLSRRVRFATVLAAVGVLSLSLFAIATESSASSPRKKPAAPVPAPAVTPIPTPGIPILPPEQITAGMKGYGFSDLGNGKGVQRFEVEIRGFSECGLVHGRRGVI